MRTSEASSLSTYSGAICKFSAVWRLRRARAKKIPGPGGWVGITGKLSGERGPHFQQKKFHIGGFGAKFGLSRSPAARETTPVNFGKINSRALIPLFETKIA